MNKKQKKMLLRILISLFMTAAFKILGVKGSYGFFLYIIPYLIIGYDIVIKAIKGIFNKQMLDENFLMFVATAGAMIIGITSDGDYTEAVAVMLFYQTGELFQSYAVGKSRRNISSLMDIRPDYANIEKDGQVIHICPDDVTVGDIIIVQPGEKIPIDGIVVHGCSTLNTVALTGESIPRDVKEGSSVISGCINMSGVIKVQTTKEFGESTASKILDLVENAGSRKSKSENFVSKFAKIYTPAVCISALMLSFLPPLISYLTGNPPYLAQWIYRGLSFLVASCPCALVISIPLSFFAGIGGASREGILIKGSNYLEALSKTSCVVFDKTGTLTHGVFEVNAVHHNTISKEKLIEYVAIAECTSSHPIAQSLQKAYGLTVNRERLKEVKEISGNGVIALVDDVNVAVGNDKLMTSLGIDYKSCHKVGTVIHIAINNSYEGHIVISDVIKSTSKQAVSSLKKLGINSAILTGDISSVAESTANSLEITEYYSELLPTDKVTKTEEILSKLPKGKMLAFVGDGINDAPVLSRSDIGIAMGAMGSDAAIEAADVVLMDDNPTKIVSAVKIARKCMRIVYQNIIFAVGIKILSLIFIAFGVANMWLAVFADVGVMIIAVLNSVRALYTKNI